MIRGLVILVTLLFQNTFCLGQGIYLPSTSEPKNANNPDSLQLKHKPKYPDIGIKYGIQTGILQQNYNSLDKGSTADLFFDISISDSTPLFLSIEFYNWKGENKNTHERYSKFGSRWLLKQKIVFPEENNVLPYFKAGFIGPNSIFPPVIAPVNLCFGAGIEFKLSKRVFILLDAQTGFTLLPGNIDPSRGFYYPTQFLGGLRFLLF